LPATPSQYFGHTGLVDHIESVAGHKKFFNFRQPKNATVEELKIADAAKNFLLVPL
jgi:hypothetical protein